MHHCCQDPTLSCPLLSPFLAPKLSMILLCSILADDLPPNAQDRGGGSHSPTHGLQPFYPGSCGPQIVMMTYNTGYCKSRCSHIVVPRPMATDHEFHQLKAWVALSWKSLCYTSFLNRIYSESCPKLGTISPRQAKSILCTTYLVNTPEIQGLYN